METILDAGAAVLRYFALYLPRAAAVAERSATGDRLPTYEDVEARYFEQRGIDLGALDADIEVLTRVAADLDDRFDDQDAVVQALEESWAGADADRAREHLGAHLARADLVGSNVAEVRCALVETSRTLREAVTRKADWVGARDASRAGGLTPEQIDTAMSGAACADSLTDLFLPHVRDTVSAFTALCDATATAVDDAYRNLACVFGQIDDSAFPVPGPLVVGDCGGPTAAPPAVCRESPAAPAGVVPGGAVGTTSPAGGTSLTGLGAPPGVGPVSPTPGSLVGGGSLALDGLVVEGTVRAVGAIVGVVADVALAVVDTVGDLVREAAAAAEPTEQAGAGCSLNLDREPCCDGAPAGRDPVPEEYPASAPPPVPPVSVAEPTVDDDCPEPEPESEMPSPVEELPAADLPTEQPSEPESVELQPTEPPVESCVPAVPPPAHPALGARPPTGRGGAAEPALAELGSEPPAPDGAAPDGAGVEIAEAGPL
ncbi:hypothetical protein ABI214_20350 [Prescottella soli]|uniref:Uncharacterized protein n=1 Tax=Prescottella soli TaxID=1543852 RepID=A0ABW9FRC1_9NOCA